MGQRSVERKNTYSAKVLKERKKERKIKKRRRSVQCVGVLLFLSIALLTAKRISEENRQTKNIREFLNQQEIMESGSEAYPEELLEMLEKNEETYEFVTGYPNRAEYMGSEIDLTEECQSQTVPPLMQWDRRWGYDSYGNDMIGVAGCGPSCMAMAYIYLTGDTSMNPRKMAEYAYENGFYTESGTSWSFFTDGATSLGISSSELPLEEGQMKSVLDNGGVVICSMRPGDFTSTGHFILIRGYDGNDFYVNDPNSRKNSEKQWDFEALRPQIKCLWGLN